MVCKSSSICTLGISTLCNMQFINANIISHQHRPPLRPISFSWSHCCSTYPYFQIISTSILAKSHQNDEYSPERSTLLRHPNSLPPSLRRLQKLPQLLLENLQALRASRVRHLQNRTPEIELVSHIGTSAKEDEEDEVDGVSEDCYSISQTLKSE